MPDPSATVRPTPTDADKPTPRLYIVPRCAPLLDEFPMYALDARDPKPEFDSPPPPRRKRPPLFLQLLTRRWTK